MRLVLWLCRQRAHRIGAPPHQDGRGRRGVSERERGKLVQHGRDVRAQCRELPRLGRIVCDETPRQVLRPDGQRDGRHGWTRAHDEHLRAATATVHHQQRRLRRGGGTPPRNTPHPSPPPPHPPPPPIP